MIQLKDPKLVLRGNCGCVFCQKLYFDTINEQLFHPCSNKDFSKYLGSYVLPVITITLHWQSKYIFVRLCETLKNLFYLHGVLKDYTTTTWSVTEKAHLCNETVILKQME